jgi:hypothetical protein
MPMTRYPDTFIIGAPKSGTTSLYEYLRGHPDVFMPAVKEPCYFARDLARDRAGSFLVYERDRDTYLALFADARDARRAGEGSTRYLYSRDAPELIRAVQPGARIVAMLRNPVDMIYSLHDHKLAGGTEDVADFEQALALEDERRAGRRLPPMSNPLLATYRDRARFGEQISRWLETFGREQVHAMIFEDFVADAATEFRRLLEFLDVDPDYRPASFAAHNPAHGTRSRRLRAALHSRPAQWMAWRAMPRVLGEARTHRLVRAFAQSPLRRRRGGRPPLADDLRHRLEAELAPDVALLSQLLGRDLRARWFTQRRAGETAREPELESATLA